MFRVASLILSLLALHLLYWYKRKNADSARLEPHHKYSVYFALLVLYWYKSTNADASRRIPGLHILEICLDGIHVPVSPLLLDVKSAICADENTVASEDGECRCDLKRQLVSAGAGK
jgi:hypothetical protein